MITERVSNFVVLRADGLGFTLKWDTKVMNRISTLVNFVFCNCNSFLVKFQNTIAIDVNEAMWNRTAGLCGRFVLSSLFLS